MSVSSNDEMAVESRPVELGDVDWLVAMSIDREAVGPHNWSGEVPDAERVRDGLIERIRAATMIGNHGGRLVVDVDGTLAGDVSWRYEQWGPSDRSRCPAIGISLLPTHRGRGIGSVAQRLLVEHLFLTTDTHRVQSDTAVDNPAEQRALEKAGFVREGVIRDAEWRDGAFHDHIVYSVLRRDWAGA